MLQKNKSPKDESVTKRGNVVNKPDWATLRPDCVSVCSDYGDKHVTYMEGQMDEQTAKTTE